MLHCIPKCSWKKTYTHNTNHMSLCTNKHTHLCVCTESMDSMDSMVYSEISCQTFSKYTLASQQLLTRQF